MNYILILFFSIILPILSLKQTKPKHCINCKHFITDNMNGEYGKCSLFPLDNINFLVNGMNKERKYSYCSTVRLLDNMCGKEGKLYKKRYQKKPKPNS